MTANLLLGILVLISHFAIVRMLAELSCSLLVPLVQRVMVKRGQQPDWWDQGHRFLVHSQFAAQFALSLAGLIVAWHSSAWQWWVRVWSSPVPLVLYLLLAALTLHRFPTRIPLTRNLARFYRHATVPVGILLLATYYFPSIRTAPTYTYGLLLAYCFLVIATIFGLWFSRRKWAKFASLDHRHTVVIEKLPRLQRLVLVLNESQDMRLPREAILQADAAADAALSHLKKDQEQGAEAALIHAESEIRYVESIISDRAQLSLADDLRASLAQYQTTLATLETEIEGCGLSAGILDELHTKLQECEAIIPRVGEPDSDLPKILEPFTALRHAISDTRTALRFFTGSGAALQRVEETASACRRRQQVFEALDVMPAALFAHREELETALTRFRHGDFNSYFDLVFGYQNIQRLCQQCQKLTELTQSTVDRRWHTVEFAEYCICVYVPKSCVMGEAVLGVVSTSTPPELEQTVTIDGTMLVLQTGKLIQIPASIDSCTAFSLAGDKDGKGRFTVSVTPTKEGRSQRSVTVRILPTIRELVQQAAIFLPLFGACGAFAFWRAGRTVNEAVPLGALVGALGVLILLLARLAITRYESMSSRKA